MQKQFFFSTIVEAEILDIGLRFFPEIIAHSIIFLRSFLYTLETKERWRLVFTV